MKITSSVLALSAAFVGVSQAEPFQQAAITRTVNSVSLVEKQKTVKAAAPGDVVRGETAVKTGSDSRAELEFPDKTITRLGANALFSFEAGGRDMQLEQGTMLFSSPKGVGGGKVQAGAITAAVTGTEFLLAHLSNGDVKLVVLEGKVWLYHTANPSERVEFTAGKAVTIPKGTLGIPKGYTINLRRLIATSRLLEGGDLGPLPRQALITRVADSQQGRIRKVPDAIVRTTEVAQTSRRTERPPNNTPRTERPPARPPAPPSKPANKPDKPYVPPPEPGPSGSPPR